MNWNYENGRIYSINESNQLLAETTFVLKNKKEVVIDHTYVNPDLRGQGVAGKMMEAIAEYLRENKLKATATCSYALIWLKKHSETYSDIISEDINNEAIACNINGKH